MANRTPILAAEMAARKAIAANSSYSPTPSGLNTFQTGAARPGMALGDRRGPTAPPKVHTRSVPR